MKRALLVLAACGDPGYGFCPDGSRIADRETGCALPPSEIVVDGELDEWAAIVGAASEPCNECTSGQVIETRVARTADDQLAIAARLRGGVADPRHEYLVAFGPLQEPSYWMYLHVAPGREPRVELNEVALVGVPFTHVFTIASLEVAIPIAALPYGGGARVTVLLEDTRGEIAQPEDASSYAYACWDATAPICAPR